jgi:ATP-dependent exoDNAse (exonuclease V) alpha subunit
MVAAWKADGRDVLGATLAWRQATDLQSAGIDKPTAMMPFLKRITNEPLNQRSVVVIDELGLIDTRQLLQLLRLQARDGFQVVAIGDPKQCQSVEAGPVITLLEKALGKDAIPEILTSIRQRTERYRETALLWREGKAPEAAWFNRGCHAKPG